MPEGPAGNDVAVPETTATQGDARVLELLRRLTQVSRRWAVWKNVEAALSETGDVDCVAPKSEWNVLEGELERWAADHRLGPVVACHHVPGAVFLVAVDPGQGRFLQLDVRARATFRGATVLRAEDVTKLMEMDSRGFRRLRPGAEGLFKLVINGVGRGGKARRSALEKERVRELLIHDPDGVEQASSLFGALRKAVVTGAGAAAEGGWDRAAMVRVEAWALARALARPAVAAGQARVRSAKRSCPILHAGIHNARRIPGDQSSWLSAVAATHSVSSAGRR